MADQTRSIVQDAELLMQNVARRYAIEGNARVVTVLHSADVRIDQTDFDNWDGGTYVYTVFLDIPQRLFSSIAKEKETVASQIHEMLSDYLHRYESTWIRSVEITPELTDSKTWREDARKWLAGEGTNNQGRVRSDNIAGREKDGLLFRSQPEIYLYEALKSLGVTFAPLPVFLRGGKVYSRIEPDFILINEGLVMCVEIDGDTVHTETPAEANSRTRVLSNEGVVVERFSASRCDTPERAQQLAAEITQLMRTHRNNR